MRRVIRCRRCGTLVSADCLSAFVRRWRLCPRCRGPLPPTTDGAEAMEMQGVRFNPFLSEAA